MPLNHQASLNYRHSLTGSLSLSAKKTSEAYCSYA